MGDYPHEVENCVPQLPGHIAIGVIFRNSSDQGFCDFSKVYHYWAPARYARYLNSDTTVVVGGVEKTVRIVDIAPVVPEHAKLKRIKSSEVPPPHLRSVALPARKSGQDIAHFMFDLCTAFGPELAAICARMSSDRVRKDVEKQTRNSGIPNHLKRMQFQSGAFNHAAELVRMSTPGQPVVPVVEPDVVGVPLSPNDSFIQAWHYETACFYNPAHSNSNSNSNIPRPSNLELIMSKASLSITTVTYLNGVDVSTLSNDEVFTILQDLRQRIERLESLPSNMRPARIDAELVRLQSAAKEIVDLLNNIDDVEAAAKRSDADAIRAVVKDELQAQLASYASDARTKPDASS